MKKYLTKKFIITTVKYIIFGLLGSAVNYVVYLICRSLGLHYQLSNTAAWLISMIYSYFSNKYLVFKHSSKTESAAFAESLVFFVTRALTLLLEYSLLHLFVEAALMPDRLAKLLSVALTGLANYLISYLVVFSAKRKKRDSTDEDRN